jgi:hypothetical protein
LLRFPFGFRAPVTPLKKREREKSMSEIDRPLTPEVHRLMQRAHDCYLKIQDLRAEVEQLSRSQDLADLVNGEYDRATQRLQQKEAEFDALKKQLKRFGEKIIVRRAEI